MKGRWVGTLWVSQGQYFIFGALCPSKSGLMNKHIVKHTRQALSLFLMRCLINGKSVKKSDTGVHFGFQVLGSVNVKCSEVGDFKGSCV